MLEDMAHNLLIHNQAQWLTPVQQAKYDSLIRHANYKNVPQWAYVFKHYPHIRGKMQKAWEASRSIYTKHAQKLQKQGKLFRPATRAPKTVNIVPKIEAWPDWQEQEQRLKHADLKPQIRIIYPEKFAVTLRPGETIKRKQTRDRLEAQFGQRVPLEIEPLVEMLKQSPYSKRITLDLQDYGTMQEATEIQARASLGNAEYEKQSRLGKKFLIYGASHYDPDSERVIFTVYCPGDQAANATVHEIHHLGLRIIRQLLPNTFKRIQHWYTKATSNGSDPSQSMDEMYAKAMSDEETARRSNLPRKIVQTGRRIFREQRSRGNIDRIIDKVGSQWFDPVFYSGY